MRRNCDAGSGSQPHLQWRGQACLLRYAANGTYEVNPGSATLAARGMATATLVIGTSATHAALLHNENPCGAPAAGLSLAAMVGLFIGRCKRIRMLSAMGLAVLLSLARC